MEKNEKSGGGPLHVVVFPWLAMGHLIPFFHLSTLVASKGHRVSFVSSPRNISRLPKIPPHLSSLLRLVSLPLPTLPNLPAAVESSTDVPYHKQQLLKRAFDLLESPLTDFLRSSSESTPADWVIYDYTPHWLPRIAAALGVSRAFFSCFNAACMAFFGTPSNLISGQDRRFKAEDFTVVPEWVPFESDVAYRVHEVAKWVQNANEDVHGTSDTVRFGVAIDESEVVAMRSSDEFEPEWFDLLRQLYGKPVISIGFLPPMAEDHVAESDEQWVGINDWLDKQRVNSVVYVALGTEAMLSQDELTELALGLEMSEVPFFWVLRDAPESTQYVSEMLPPGFVERVEGRGVVHFGWAPQVRILSHDSVGGFLTHCGWNSMIEGLAFGRVLILFPMVNDQGLNARLGTSKRLGVEIPKNEQDGSFTSDAVAKLVRLTMVEDSGASLRSRAKEMKDLFGDRNRNNQMVDKFICFLEENRPSRLII